MSKITKPEVDYVVKMYENISDFQKHLNQWRYDYDLSIEAMNVVPVKGIKENYLIIVVVKRIRKRQFTGLYDKNGREICEKDIVKQGSVLGKVFFEDGCFWVKWENKDEPDQLYWVNDKIEVIGNVCVVKDDLMLKK